MGEELMREELRRYYSEEADARAEAFCQQCLDELDARYEPGMTPTAMKLLQYRVITEHFEPVLFPHSPFYFEAGTQPAICDGARELRGHRHAGGWVYWKNRHIFEEQDPELFDLVRRQKDEKLYWICGAFTDDKQHFCFYHRPVLQMGLSGVYEQARLRMQTADAEGKEFLDAVCRGLLCLKAMSGKFADAAERAARQAADPEVRANMERIAASARRTPWQAPDSFYEALNQYAFLRKAVGTLEGVGVNTFGRIDMDLWPFYQRDVARGALTPDEAYRLIRQFLITFDCHYDHDMKFVGYADHELENTYVLGGCDAEGKPLCNELTLMFLRATREEKIIFPKIKLRYSADSPEEMLREACKALVKGTSVILYQNDDATIPAMLRTGQPPEKARDYLITGCWGLYGNGYEKQEGGSYVNLIKPLELAVHRDFAKMKEVGMDFAPLDGAQSFGQVYGIVLDNLRVLLTERARVTRAGAGAWSRVDALPLYSSTLEDCVQKGRDFIRGGAREQDSTYELFAAPSVVDSLLVIKELCFDSGKYTLDELLTAVRADWAGYDQMRMDATRCHGWGDGSEASIGLCRRLNEDIYSIMSGLTGTYGGRIRMGHLAYTEVRWWGERTRATPDGRRGGEYLSQGLTPSRLKRIPNITDVVRSMAGLDASLLAGNSVINIILPCIGMTVEKAAAFLRATARSAIMSLQLNCTSREQLLDAQKHPEKYPDLIVRVTGFSAKFTSLSPEWQQEVITRNFYE